MPHEAYDAITSSGDVTRGIVKARLRERVFHLGPPRDLPIFAGLEVEFAPVENADYVVCSGLFDDTIETPENYRDLLAAMRARALFMVCANPDVVVERGDTLVYCAGALADAYAELGGVELLKTLGFCVHVKVIVARLPERRCVARLPTEIFNACRPTASNSLLGSLTSKWTCSGMTT